MQRQRSRPHTFEDQIAAEKVRLEAEAAKLSAGPARDVLITKIRHLDAASQMNAWLSVE